jgi:hypothetical protein
LYPRVFQWQPKFVNKIIHTKDGSLTEDLLGGYDVYKRLSNSLSYTKTNK